MPGPNGELLPDSADISEPGGGGGGAWCTVVSPGTSVYLRSVMEAVSVPELRQRYTPARYADAA